MPPARGWRVSRDSVGDGGRGHSTRPGRGARVGSWPKLGAILGVSFSVSTSLRVFLQKPYLLLNSSRLLPVLARSEMSQKSFHHSCGSQRGLGT
jgi:hypothetical protein